MLPRKNKKRAESSPKPPGSGKKWGRLGTQPKKRTSDVDGGGGSSDSATSEPQGPLQSQPDLDRQDGGEDPPSTWDSTHSTSYEPPSRPRPPPVTTDEDDGGTRGIDDIVDCVWSPSSSSNHAVLAFSGSSSTCAPAARKPDRPITPSSNPPPHKPPQSPLSTSQRRRPRSGSNALETPKDKDDAYGAWWFLTSISESFDTAQSNISGRRTPLGMRTNIVSREAYQNTVIPEQNDDEESATNTKSIGNDAALELPPWKKETDSSSSMLVEHQSQQQHQKNQPYGRSKHRSGGEYTLKEQKIRQDWLAKDALGGTLNYDQDMSGSSSVSPYYYIPNQQASTAMVKRSKSEEIEWTPRDSSYGAAVPAFGWIPKRVRKLLEGMFVVLIILLLIFVVVKTGIKLKSSGSGGGEDIYFKDDDHYIAYSDDEEYESGSQSNDTSNDGNDQ